MRLSLMLALLILGCAPAATAQTNVPVAPFRSVALSEGGHVSVRYGEAQRVTLISGDADIATEGDRLRIRKCRACAGRDRLQVEIVTPVLEALSVEDGGSIEVADGFPSQAELSAAVTSGGAVDARRLAARHVSASVAQGGSILAQPMSRLDATVSHGGIITYWGDPVVRSAVSDGGAVTRGRPGDEQKPFVGLRPSPPKAPSQVPPVPEMPR